MAGLLTVAGVATAQDLVTKNPENVVRGAEIQLSGTSVSLTPLFGYKNAELRVVGPGGYEAARSFSGEPVLTLGLLGDRVDDGGSSGANAPAGSTSEKDLGWLSDGQYSYELTYTTAEGGTGQSFGSFYVYDGVAQPQALLKGGADLEGAASEGFFSSTSGTKSLIENDFFETNDLAGDGFTALHLDEDNPDQLNAGFWSLANDQTVFRIYQGYAGNAGATGTPRFNILQGSNFGLNTTTPALPLHVVSTQANVFRMTTGSTDVTMEAGPNAFVLNDDQNEEVFIIYHDTTSASRMVLRGAGAGFGTSSPLAPIDVFRTNNTAQVLVRDTGSSSPQQMFTLDNNGFPRFTLTDSSTGESWDFRLSAGKFTITRVGTGGPEFEIFNNGSAEFRGSVTANGVLLTSSRESKTGFGAVDPATVLEKVAALDVSQWRYKEEPATAQHIGPMAEDFQAVFGLGDGKHISAGDANGILFAAAKALKAESEVKDARIAELEARLARLESLLTE